MSRYRPKPKLDEALAVVARAEEAGYFARPWEEHDARIAAARLAASAAGKLLPYVSLGRESWDKVQREVEELVASLLDGDERFARRVINTRMQRGSGRPGAKRY